MPLAATRAPYTLFIVDDDMPLNPREDYDCLGKIQCAIITSSFFVWTPALLFHVIKTLSTKECNIIFASTKVKL